MIVSARMNQYTGCAELNHDQYDEEIYPLHLYALVLFSRRFEQAIHLFCFTIKIFVTIQHGSGCYYPVTMNNNTVLKELLEVLRYGNTTRVYINKLSVVTS